MSRRQLVRRLLGALGCMPALAVAVLALWAVSLPLPPAFEEPPAPSVEIVDRHGKLLREVRGRAGELGSGVKLRDLSPSVVPALLAAEDSRFFSHPGVDPLAVARALGELVAERRVVSGGSTITQQLARTVVPRPRTLLGKLREMALALRIEGFLDKEQILEEYLSRVEFGPNLRGIDVASRWYFDKPPAQLDLSEAAALAAMPRSPVLYDPRKSLEPLTRRRKRVLERMREMGLAPADALDRALATPLRLQSRFIEAGVEHLALALGRGAGLSGLSDAGPFRRVETTLDAALQREVQVLARRAAEGLREREATALAVLVVDNASGEVLVHVGSPDYFAVPEGGANDGVRALRQPGSTLKPFVYAAAMEAGVLTPSTLLPDLDLVIPTPAGPYRPRNYDGRTHGPVRLRQALGSSLNVPAVHTADAVGPDRVLALLRRAGFESLDRPAAHYGTALALGDGEVRLAELAEAYALLARGGERVPLSALRAAWTADGRRVAPAPRAPSRVLPTSTAALLTDILSDDAARAAGFGRDGELVLPFPVAAKTGTSKGHRDNWTVGFTREVTVAVWVGNFDGSPMKGSTGITGAAPLFHDVMVAAMRGRTPAPLVDRGVLASVTVCAESGHLAGPHCPHHVTELFASEHAPLGTCRIHARVWIDRDDGLLSRPGCPGAEERTLERYPTVYRAWAAGARRPVVPEETSPRCPGAAARAEAASVARVRFPLDGSRFAWDPEDPRQEIVLAADPSPADTTLRFVLDGRPLAVVRAPFEVPWRLTPGKHRLEVRGATAANAIAFDVH